MSARSCLFSHSFLTLRAPHLCSLSQGTTFPGSFANQFGHWGTLREGWSVIAGEKPGHFSLSLPASGKVRAPLVVNSFDSSCCQMAPPIWSYSSRQRFLASGLCTTISLCSSNPNVDNSFPVANHSSHMASQPFHNWYVQFPVLHLVSTFLAGLWLIRIRSLPYPQPRSWCHLKSLGIYHNFRGKEDVKTS